jgi:hypothetical protein
MTRQTTTALTLLAAAASALAQSDGRVLQDFERVALQQTVLRLDSTTELVDRGGGKALAVTTGTKSPYPTSASTRPTASRGTCRPSRGWRSTSPTPARSR